LKAKAKTKARNLNLTLTRNPFPFPVLIEPALLQAQSTQPFSFIRQLLTNCTFDLLVPAMEQIDVVIPLGCAPQHHPVRMEGRRGNGRRLGLVEVDVAAIRFDAR
jgi:hypothetical protein